MAENSSESVDIDPPPTPTETHLDSGPVTGSCCSLGLGLSPGVCAGGCRSAVGLGVFEIKAQAVNSTSK